MCYWFQISNEKFLLSTPFILNVRVLMLLKIHHLQLEILTSVLLCCLGPKYGKFETIVSQFFLVLCSSDLSSNLLPKYVSNKVWKQFLKLTILSFKFLMKNCITLNWFCEALVKKVCFHTFLQDSTEFPQLAVEEEQFYCSVFISTLTMICTWFVGFAPNRSLIKYLN